MKTKTRLRLSKRFVAIDHRKREMSAIAEIHGLDVQDVWSLFEFQSTVLHGSCNSFSFVGKLRGHVSAIRNMGAILKTFGLARHVKGTLHGWRPRRRLYKILAKKLAPLKLSIADKEICHTAVLEALWEICGVLNFVISMEGALGRNPYKRIWNLTPEFEQLIIGKSVQDVYPAARCAPLQRADPAKLELVWSRPMSPNAPS